MDAAEPPIAPPDATFANGPPETLAPIGGPTRRRPMPAPVQVLLAGVLIPLLVSLIILWILQPSLLLLPTTPTGFDLGGHVYPLAEAVEALPDGIPAWSDGWFGGFPLYHFYFPLPAVLVWLLGFVAPFEVAVKLVSVLGILGLPFATYVLARGVGFSRWVSGACVLGAGAFAFMQSYWYLGGNLSSTLAGEFSYGLSFTLSLIYLGLVARTARGGPRLGVIASLVLALTALSHLLTTAVVVVASLPLLTIRRSQRAVFVSWVVGFLLAGFWTVPFLLRAGLLPDIVWDESLTLAELFPREIWLLLPLALAGGILTLGKRSASVPLLVPPLLGLAFFFAGSSAIHPGRLLPYWFFAIHVLAAVFTGGAVRRYLRDRSPVAFAGGLLGLVAFAVVVGVREYRDLRTWATWNYSGYETKPGWPVYEALIETFRQLPPGRVHWEDAEIVASFGSLNALSLLPYWSPEHPAVGGLWLESSLTAPTFLLAKREMSRDEAGRSDPRLGPERALDFERGVAHMRLLGARYYVAFTPEAVALAQETVGLTTVAASEAFSIFEVSDVYPVEVLGTLPVVADGGDFQDAVAAWLDDPDGFGRLLVADGPSGWPRIGDPVLGPPTSRGYGHVGDPEPVSEVTMGAREITFTTLTVGVPHFVRAAYFPNWRAEGALGPYLAAPSFMVVVPNRESVRLSYRRTWVEWLGILLSLLGAAAFLSGMLHHGLTWAFLTRNRGPPHATDHLDEVGPEAVGAGPAAVESNEASDRPAAAKSGEVSDDTADSESEGGTEDAGPEADSSSN
jgi:hypothetical protein